MLSPFDVRTNLYALITISLVVLSHDVTLVLFLVFALIISLLLVSRAWRGALVVTTYVAVLLTLFTLVKLLPDGALKTILYASLRLGVPFICSACMGYYFLKVTPANVLLTGLHRLRCPRALTTALAVMFRLLPTLSDNARAIGDAMKVRGLPKRFFLCHPIQALEYFVIPFISATIRSGEALTAAALTRGLATPTEPTSIHMLQFRWQDGVLFTITTLLAVGAWI